MSNKLFSTNIAKLERDLKQQPESFWIQRGEKMALELFQEMARRVPAYKDFLKKNKINPAKIKTVQDLKKVPALDKDNYLRKYPLEDLCWDGSLTKMRATYSSTSGTTGEPFYFPRSIEQDQQYALVAELYLRENFQIQKKSTLYIDGFAMGPWIGGVFTYEAIRIVAEKGQYDLSIITPGSNKQEIIKAIKKLGLKYDQILLGGYPPFVKDTLDEGDSLGLNWKKYNIKFVFSAEGFSEAFRDYVYKKVGAKNIFLDSLNHYGIVDVGTAAYETPICIKLRRMALKNKNIHQKIFGEVHRTATLAQYLPEMFYFEEQNGILLCSARSGLPLVRYNLKDRGGVLQFADIKKIKDSTKGIPKPFNLPFVFVHERSDMVVSWYGANIYPEHIREAHLENSLQKYLTGKFTVEMTADKKHNPVLEIHVQMKKNIAATQRISAALSQAIIANFMKKNSEYRNNRLALPEQRTNPKISLHKHEDPYFASTGKHKWVNKQK